MNFLLC